MADNYWDKLMGDDAHAAEYMATYGEGPGFETRHTVGSFINEGESVLDVGCGPGWNMDHFAQFGPALSVYKGVDYSQRFVRVANKRLDNHLDENFTTIQILPFEKQDCRELREDDGSYDVVVLQDCLEHTDGYRVPVLEALRVARKRVIVSFWHMTENDDHINDDGDDGYGAWYSRGPWEEFLDKVLRYNWMHYEIEPEGRNHKWDFYIIEKEDHI